MNFAQLIDPEWVQAGCPVRFPRRSPAPVAPMGTVVYPPIPAPEAAAEVQPSRYAHTGMSRRVLGILAEAKLPMCAWEIADLAPPLTAQQVSNALFSLRAQRLVVRTGPHGKYAYSATKEGRARL